jgi:PAS domain S-box-containing protein
LNRKHDRGKIKDSATKNSKAVGLRRKAEERLNTRLAALKYATDVDLRRLAHELQVHQIELEMQNEELHRIQKELEESRDRYSDLYDFAPVGYLTLNKTGLILEANITAAGQLGLEKSFLINRPFYHYIERKDRDVLYLHLREVFQNKKSLSCEISIRRKENVFEARLDSILVRNSGHNSACRTSIINITEKKLTEEKIRQTAEEWEKTFNSVDHLISIQDKNYKFLRVNKAFADFFRVNQKDIIGKTCYEVVHKTIKPWPACPHRQAIKLKKPVRMEILNPHTESCLEVSAIPMFDDNNEVVRTVHIMKDVTDRKRAERELQKEKDRAQHYLDIAGVMILTIDAGQNITLINKKGCKILECSRDAVVGKNWFDTFIPDRLRDEVKAVFTKLIGGEISPSEYFENPVVTAKGREKLIAWHNSVLRNQNGDIIGTLSSGEDITGRKQSEEELKIYRNHLEQLAKNRTAELAKANVSLRQEIKNRQQAEENLRKSHKQLRDLTTHLEFIREKERGKIARDIHDELGQSLTALKMDLSWLKKRLQKGQEALSEKAGSMSKLIGMTIKTVQRISSELRPGLLDDLGLAEAIEWQAKEFQNRTGIECRVFADTKDILLDKDRSTAVFRVLQEALTNVARHADATSVIVNLKAKSGKLLLEVKDNGKGITKGQLFNPRSFGLIGMQERINSQGGRVKISSMKNKGTTVTVSIPIN